MAITDHEVAGSPRFVYLANQGISTPWHPSKSAVRTFEVPQDELFSTGYTPSSELNTLVNTEWEGMLPVRVSLNPIGTHCPDGTYRRWLLEITYEEFVWSQALGAYYQELLVPRPSVAPVPGGGLFMRTAAEEMDGALFRTKIDKMVGLGTDTIPKLVVSNASYTVRIAKLTTIGGAIFSLTGACNATPVTILGGLVVAQRRLLYLGPRVERRWQLGTVSRYEVSLSFLLSSQPFGTVWNPFLGQYDDLYAGDSAHAWSRFRKVSLVPTADLRILLPAG